MGEKTAFRQSVRMQTALLLSLGLGSILVGAGAFVALSALRRAPDGVETEDGFQFTGAMRQPVAVNANANEHFARAVGANA